MGVDQTILSGVVGGVAGLATAWVTAEGKVRTVRVETDAKLRELREKRAYAVADRESEAEGAARAGAAAATTSLQQAAANLVTALNAPDAMGRNVRQAQSQVNVATASITQDSELHEIARELREASLAEDVTRAEAVLRRF